MVTKITEKTSPLTPEYLAAIGEVVTTWSRFELMLDLHIALTTGSPDLHLSVCVSAQIPMSGRKLDALIALFGYHGASHDELKPLRSVAARADELQRKRNRYIHDAWSFGTETNSAYRLEMTANKSLTFEHKVVPLGELKDFIRDAFALIDRFQAVEDSVSRLPSVAASLHAALSSGRAGKSLMEVAHPGGSRPIPG